MDYNAATENEMNLEINEDMARCILLAINTAEFESVLSSEDENVKAICQSIETLFPNLKYLSILAQRGS